MMARPRIPMLFVGGRLSEWASRNAHYSLLHNLGNRRKCGARQFRDWFPVFVWGIPKWLRPRTLAGGTHHDTSYHAGHFVRFAEVVVNPWHRKDMLERRAWLGIVSQKNV